MTPAEFKKKWGSWKGKETAAYQEHFSDLCRMLGQPTPVEADPSGEETFCFQKRCIKDAELFVLKETGEPYGDEDEPEGGFADVWKKGCFAWEYKGKKKNLDKAYRQLLRYREALLNPPLLAVCDFDRFIIRTNFNGTVQDIYDFTNNEIDDTRHLRVLRALFEDPALLKPQRTTSQITEELASKIADIARSLQERESVELHDARTRKELHVGQKKNLRIAQFLNRITFCFFAEDTGLLPERTFFEVTKAGIDDPRFFAERLEELFRAMSTGGSFGARKIRHFNGHLFEDVTVFELTPEEIRALADASEADWQYIEPTIFGTLFERALDDSQRAQLGAHYTSPDDIRTLVEPVLMAPLRREWVEIKRGLLSEYVKEKGTTEARKQIENFLKKLSVTKVLDPACGSGNFLYIALQFLLSLEKEVITFATQLGFRFQPRVGVQQLKAIEINPYAFELAQVSVQIGYLQWMRDNGFTLDRTPVLQTLDGFENCDALMREVFHHRPKDLKEAKAAEHAEDKGVKGYIEKVWPDCDVIVSNPPFLGGKLLRRQLGDDYVTALFDVFADRVPAGADLCCYWHEKARALIEERNCRRAGLLATQGIRGGANREILKRIKGTGGIFWAESDRPWILAGANVHVSMVGFDDGSEKERILDAEPVSQINSNLTAGNADTTQAQPLKANGSIGFMGDTKVGPFELPAAQALEMLAATNPHGKPNSDVLRPWVNGLDITRRSQGLWIIDFPPETTEEDASRYEVPFEHIHKHVKPFRADARSGDRTGVSWWIHQRPRPDMREALTGQPCYIATPTIAKHRLFALLNACVLPDHQLIVFALAGDYFLGILHSRPHEVWALAQGTQLREKESGFRYTPTTCFETFPFPAPGENEAAIAAAAKELNELRERWLNPPEWTKTEALEFPGTVGGPWTRFIDEASVREIGGVKVGTVRYPRIVANDAECAEKLKDRTLTKLYNERPAWLDLAHRKLDEAVAAAYGWPADLTDDQIVERLLKLNLERAAQEAKTAHLKPRTSRAKREDEML